MKKVMATRNFFNQAMTQQKNSAEKSHAYIGKYSNIFCQFHDVKRKFENNQALK